MCRVMDHLLKTAAGRRFRTVIPTAAILTCFHSAPVPILQQFKAFNELNPNTILSLLHWFYFASALAVTLYGGDPGPENECGKRRISIIDLPLAGSYILWMGWSDDQKDAICASA